MKKNPIIQELVSTGFKHLGALAICFDHEPKCRGVYCVFSKSAHTNNNPLVYIGCSNNISTRIKSHPIWNHRGNRSFSFYYLPTENYKIIEKELIQKYNPIYNCHYNNGKKLKTVSR